MFLELTLEGGAAAQHGAYNIGRQHGKQVEHLRPLLSAVMKSRLAGMERSRPEGTRGLRDLVAPVVEAMETHDRPLLDFLAGLSHALSFTTEEVVAYTFASYLTDVDKITHDFREPASRYEDERGSLQIADGCTTWAACGASTVEGRPILAKNRDYHRDHIPLQVFSRISPAGGYRYLALGSAGSPHVFSSGINERGLAIADTHVLSRDIGLGLPRFSLMREVLEHHDTTQSALGYLRSVPHMGAGTLILADTRCHLAICESGHERSGYVEAGSVTPANAKSFLSSTNHFVTPELAGAWVEDVPPLLEGNSTARRNRVLATLAANMGRVDAAWAQSFMSTHGSAQDAICRHPLAPTDGASRAGVPWTRHQPQHPSYYGSTISSVIFLPLGLSGDEAAFPAVILASGHPCQAQWETRTIGPRAQA